MNLRKKNFYFKNITIGSWITLYNPGIAEIFSQNKFDWIVVDLEHSAISIDQASDLIRIIDLCGCRPLVRLTSNSKDLTKRVLDAGAHGIIVPMINSKDEAKKAVSYSHYMPKGVRGVGLARAQGYGSKFDEYVRWQENEPLIIAQIEHVNAINNIEEIVSVSGIDGVFIGPYDLSGSIGRSGDFTSTKYKNSIKKVKAVVKSKNKILGIHVVEPDVFEVNKAIRDGFSFISFSVDIRILDSNIKNAIQKIRK